MVDFAEMMRQKKAQRLAAESELSDIEQERGVQLPPKSESKESPVILSDKQIETIQSATPVRVNPFAKLKSTTPLVDQEVKRLESGEMTLDDLEESEDEGTTYVGRVPTESQFEDETPATAPIRELPEDLTKQQQGFVDLIDNVYGVIGDPELLGNVIKSIMIELKANPQYMQMVAKDDVRMWVKAMRDSMGLARIKKQDKATKRASGAGSKSSKGADTDMMADLDDLLGGVEL